MPFKLSQHKIVIFKDLPVIQCTGCGEFLLADPVMAEVEASLEKPYLKPNWMYCGTPHEYPQRFIFFAFDLTNLSKQARNS